MAAKWVEFLERIGTVKLIMVFHTFVVHIFHPMKRTYEKRYGSAVETPSRGSSSSSDWNDNNDDQQQQKREQQRQQQQQQRLSTNEDELCPRMRTMSRRVDLAIYQFNGDTAASWKWHGLPDFYVVLGWFRTASTICMIYVIVKNCIPNSASELLPLVYLDKPLHCYLVGRFVIHEEVKKMTSVLFAFYHLSWRYTQLYAGNPIATSVIYFLMLDEQDLKLYYKLLEQNEPARDKRDRSQKRARLSLTQATDNHYHHHHGGFGSISRHSTCWKSQRSSGVDKRLQFMHDVMSYRLDYSNQTRYELRPNRTYEVSRHLSRRIVVFSLTAFVCLTILAIVITSLILYQILNVRHYLHEYKDCSPELQQLEASGKLPDWSMKFYTNHQILALVADVLENFFIWFESGMVATFDISLTALLNYDLYLYWWNVDKNIEETLKIVLLNNADEQNQQLQRKAIGCGHTRDKSNRGRPSAPGQLLLSELPTHDNPSSIYSSFYKNQLVAGRIFKLQMQIQDLIKEINRTNDFITDSYSVVLIMWFTIFAYCTYKLFSNTMPPTITILLSFLLFMVIITGIVILTTQRNCRKSYTKICSLMAYDRSQYKRNFIKILEYFVKNRTCFTIFRGYTMKSSTLLTIIGYSFSCFFILGSMYNR